MRSMAGLWLPGWAFLSGLSPGKYLSQGGLALQVRARQPQKLSVPSLLSLWLTPAYGEGTPNA